jgi:hypothetical protein
MAAPAQVNVLYTFRPTVMGDWTDQYIEEWNHGEYGAGGGSIVPAFDINVWAFNDYTEDCMAWKLAPHMGTVHRVKCTFSISALPWALRDDLNGILSIGYTDDRPALYRYVGLYVDNQGHLALDYALTRSTRAITVGTTYDVEIYAKVGPIGEGNELWQLYIDGELWVEEAGGYAWWESGNICALFMGSFDGYAFYNGDDGYISVDTVIRNLVWTMEDTQTGSGVWTMMLLPPASTAQPDFNYVPVGDGTHITLTGTYTQ